MSIVFLVHHVARKNERDEDVKLIGVYSIRENADAAVRRLSSKPGFIEYPDGFHVDEYELDRDHWTDGFVTIP